MPEDSADTSPESPPVWAAPGPESIAEFDGFIIGSPAGLRVLRDHIDEAIQNGVSDIEVPGIEFNGIECTEKPRSDFLPGGRLTPFGEIVFKVLMLICMAFGAYSFVNLIRGFFSLTG